MQLLQGELLETRKQKKEIEGQKIRLEKEQEKHITRVVNAHLRDLWLVGARNLFAYKITAELGQKILKDSEKVKPSRNWDPSNESSYINWDKHMLYERSEFFHEDRTKWGEPYMVYHLWECSKELGHTEKSLAKYNVSCFEEWEQVFRGRIETVGEERKTLNILDFSKGLLRWLRFQNVNEEVQKSIRRKLTNKLHKNQNLGNLPIQLRVIRGVSIKEIAEEAKQILANLALARDWLDEATKDRKLWAPSSENTETEGEEK